MGFEALGISMVCLYQYEMKNNHFLLSLNQMKQKTIHRNQLGSFFSIITNMFGN